MSKQYRSNPAIMRRLDRRPSSDYFLISSERVFFLFLGHADKVKENRRRKKKRSSDGLPFHFLFFSPCLIPPWWTFPAVFTYRTERMGFPVLNSRGLFSPLFQVLFLYVAPLWHPAFSLHLHLNPIINLNETVWTFWSVVSFVDMKAIISRILSYSKLADVKSLEEGIYFPPLSHS